MCFFDDNFSGVEDVDHGQEVDQCAACAGGLCTRTRKWTLSRGSTFGDAGRSALLDLAKECCDRITCGKFGPRRPGPVMITAATPGSQASKLPTSQPQLKSARTSIQSSRVPGRSNPADGNHPSAKSTRDPFFFLFPTDFSSHLAARSLHLVIPHAPPDPHLRPVPAARDQDKNKKREKTSSHGSEG